jgi:dTMP kinase
VKGLFITFEGVEGCGKSTQIRLLEEHLRRRGIETIATREPGGVPIAEAVRAVLLDPAHTAMAPMTEILLYEAARAQIVRELIRPALAAGMVVLCDRFADSTTAYQGAARELPREEVRYLHRLAVDAVWPDHTFLLDLAPETGLARARGRGRSDRMEQEPGAFHERVRAGFLEIAREEPERITVLDADRPVDVIARDIREAADRLTGAGAGT